MRWPGIVERERHAQALRPVAQGRELRVGRRLGTGQRLPSSSAQAPRRSLATCSLRVRSSSRWRSTIQPDTQANSSNTTTTVA